MDKIKNIELKIKNIKDKLSSMSFDSFQSSLLKYKYNETLDKLEKELQIYKRNKKLENIENI